MLHFLSKNIEKVFLHFAFRTKLWSLFKVKKLIKKNKKPQRILRL